MTMIIRRNDLVIRDAGKADCDQLAAWWSDGKVMAHAGFPLGLHTTPDEIEAKISQDSDETRRRLIIEYQGKRIGEMSYSIEDQTAEIGIKICDSSYQEKGLGRVLLSMLIRELFSRGYSTIKLDTNLNNVRAQHVYEKLGFHQVQVHENSWKNQLGELQSSVDYELTPEAFIDFS